MMSDKNPKFNYSTTTTDNYTERSLHIAVFLIGFVSLGFELMQVKMLSFFLGNISNFLAIPIALFGLALGSLFCHFIYRGNPHKLISTALPSVFPVILVTLLFFFFVANTWFSEIHMAVAKPGKNAAQMLIYAAIFLPPYFLFGMLLSSIFSLRPDRIGRLYFYDLAGAALGCLTVPILFTFTDLPVVILAILFVTIGLIFASDFRFKKTAAFSATGVFILVAVLAHQNIVFHETPDAARLASCLVPRGGNVSQTEMSVRWNHIARTSLISYFSRKDKNEKRPRYVIVQDDGISNVRAYPYDAKRTPQDVTKKTYKNHAMPFILGIEPQNILVMFAGAGRDMVLLDALSRHRAKITGVEINPQVIDFATDFRLRSLKLDDFLSRPGIELVNREGRDFLNNATEKYDFIFTATNGSVYAARTGHTRKYLDTYEAMAAYLDHLTPDGVMFFWNQPIEPKLVSFKKLFEERGLPDVSKSVFVYGDTHSDGLRCMLVKPGGFTDADRNALQNWIRISHTPRSRVLAGPNGANSRFAALLKGEEVPDTSAEPVTDDAPFINKVELENFTLSPGHQLAVDSRYASDWIKIFTVLVFTVISILVILLVRFIGPREKRLPFMWLFYFLSSGIGYMGIEIGLIAKVELFVGNPLYAVAVILAAFLLFNAAGAYLQDRFHILKGWKTMLFYTFLSVCWSLGAAALYNTYLLSIPLPLKIIAVAVAVIPSGLCLGMYYPFGVSTLAKAGKGATVPVTYAIATLSSVIGSALAMTAIVNLGFSTVIAIGGLCYAIASLFFVAARRFAL